MYLTGHNLNIPCFSLFVCTVQKKMLENTLFNNKYTAFQLDIKHIRKVEVNDLQVMYLELKVNHVQYKVRVLHSEWLTSQQ